MQGGRGIKKRGGERESKVDTEREEGRKDNSLVMSCFPLVRRARGGIVDYLKRKQCMYHKGNDTHAHQCPFRVTQSSLAVQGL